MYCCTYAASVSLFEGLSKSGRSSKCMLRKPQMRLANLARELAASNGEEEDKGIDFSSAGLYLPAAQTVFATCMSSAVSVLSCWLIPIGAISAVRTLALTTVSGALIIRRPLKIGNAKGVNTIFSALRPCCFIYVMCLVLEQLVHTCVSEESTYEHGFWRRVIYHTGMTIMTLAAFMRSRSPRSESDVPFLVAIVVLFLIAVLPPPALALSGPLCSPPTLVGAGERILRAFLFACVYTMLVYSAAPISNNLADTIVCIARSATASAWILGAAVYTLPLAAVQIVVVLYCSFQTHNSAQYESVSAFSDASFNTKEEEIGRISPAIDDDIVATAAALTRSINPLIGERLNGGGLSFQLSLGKNATAEDQQQQLRMAQVAASIA